MPHHGHGVLGTASVQDHIAFGEEVGEAALCLEEDKMGFNSFRYMLLFILKSPT